MNAKEERVQYIFDRLSNKLDGMVNNLYEELSAIVTLRMAERHIRKEVFQDEDDFQLDPAYPSMEIQRILELGAKDINEGNILAIHEKRQEMISSMALEAKEDPLLFRDYIDNMKYYKAIMGNVDIRGFHNFMSNSKIIRYNLAELHYVLSRSVLGKDVYILTVDSDGNITPKGYTMREKDLLDWMNIVSHMFSYIIFPPGVMDSLVLPEERWSDGRECDNYPGIPRGDEIGSQMLRSGVNGKVYHSDKPHEIIIDYGNISRITVIDRPQDECVYYKVRHANRTISVGALSFHGDDITFFPSDTSAICANNKRCLGYDKLTDIHALVGSIARDMFVCIDKTKHYKEGRAGPPKKRRKRKNDRITWLPRFRVHLEGYQGRDLDEKVWEVAPHDVSGHIRRCENPSLKQLELADGYGVKVPSGYTFVKPYEKGGHTAGRLYKSRSALRTLFGRDG